jgi:SAM-dependent methyltransferase
MARVLLSERRRLPEVSDRLRRFTEEMPYERRSILAFVADVAAGLDPGARVADVGAGEAPYRELFAHTDYTTIDWPGSQHSGALESDIIASAEEIPVADGSFDSLLLTQLLEHVPSPDAVLAEMHRILRPGGTINLTAPLAWELHEMPHDYFRYTSSGLEALLRRAGFEAIAVRARNDCFTTLAQLVQNVGWAMGSAADGLEHQRAAAREVLGELAVQLAGLAPLDVDFRLPLGYAATARRPADGGAAAA